MQTEQEEIFAPIQFFEQEKYHLFGADEQPVALEALIAAETGAPKIENRIAKLRNRNAWLSLKAFFRKAASLVGWEGLVLSAALLVSVFGFLLANTAFKIQIVAFSLFIGIPIFGFFHKWRDMFRGRGNFWTTKKAKQFLQAARQEKELNRAETSELQRALNVWERVSAPIRPSVRQLVRRIQDYNANVKFYNAEAKRAKFFVERGHLKLEEAAAGLQAMRQTLIRQRREIIETIMSADAACIAQVCQPTGEQALISPRLEALRDKLDRVSLEVRDQLTLEELIERELRGDKSSRPPLRLVEGKRTTEKS
jgi:hypothetical protein